MVKLTRTRRFIGIVILLISLALLCWGLWPLADAVRVVPIPPENMQLPTPNALLPMWQALI